MNIGYIYIRINEYWDIYNACKLGKTQNIPEREGGYVTCEIKRGTFIMVIEVEASILDDVEKRIQKHFKELHVFYGCGNEFFKKDIIDLILPWFDDNDIRYRLLLVNEVDKLLRKDRESNDNVNNSSNELWNPRDYQHEIIKKSYDYFQTSDKGMLVLTCGVGKTLISLWISKELNMNTILIGVPNILLLKQWKNEINKIFPTVRILMVESDIGATPILKFLTDNRMKCIVITTYASSHKIYTTTRQNKFVFDMKINDEVHHLTSDNIEKDGKTYVNMLKIPSKKQISLTATIKLLESENNETIVSNDNTKYFGDVIDRKCMLWAINQNIICDYVIQTIVTDEEQLDTVFNIFEENDKRLFLSAFAALKSMIVGHSHHLLIYSNDKKNSNKIVDYITLILDKHYFEFPDDLYYSSYNSDMNKKEQKHILNNFENSSFGIITCVYCLGEGWDFPRLDGVVFAENMSSNIRIVQSALRASRKNKYESNKITKIILPILNRYDWLDNNDNSDLKKVREVIYQLGLEDETIKHKIKVFRIDIDKKRKQQINRELPDNNDGFGEYDDELTQKLRLKTLKRTALDITYTKAVKIIADKNIKSKESYYELCDRDNRLSKEPEIIFRGQFTNWIEYLSIERIYYNLEKCKDKVSEYLLTQPDLKKYLLDLDYVCKELCKLDDNFPPNGLWCEYYKVKLEDIIVFVNKKKKCGIIL